MEDAQSVPSRRKMGWKKKLLITGGGVILICAIGLGIGFLWLNALEKNCAGFDAAKIERACSWVIDNEPDADAQTYLRLGSAEESLGHFGPAEQTYGKLIQCDPNNAEAFYGRSVVDKDQKKTDREMSDLNTALSLDPKLGGAYVQRASDYILQHRYEDALADLNKALDIEPKNAFAFGLRGVDERMMKEYDKAEQDYGRSIELMPKAFSNGDILESLLSLYMEEGNLNKATSEYDRLILQSPTFAFGRGKARFYSLSPSASIDDFRKAISLNDPPSGYSVLWLHIALQRVGQDDKQ